MKKKINKRKKECFAYRFFKPLVLGIFKLKYHPKVIGKGNIPESGPVIFCGNHRHVADQFNVMLATNRVIHYMAKSEYFKNKISACIFRSVGCISVNRSIHDTKAKSEAMDVLLSGGALGIFPEGTRNKTFGTKNEVPLLPFKFGAVSLAKKTNALIIPFGVSGEYTGKKGKLTTRIGKPIDIKDMELEDANELLRKKILELMQK